MHHKTMTTPSLKQRLPHTLLSKEKSYGKNVLRCGGMDRIQRPIRDRAVKPAIRSPTSASICAVGDEHATRPQATLRSYARDRRAWPPLKYCVIAPILCFPEYPALQRIRRGAVPSLMRHHLGGAPVTTTAVIADLGKKRSHVMVMCEDGPSHIFK
jgi:hypothetical protein